MPVDSVTAAAAATTASTPPVTPPKKALDAEVFLQLLVAQMKNQDPSSPLDTNEMMAQTTQLAMMEQLTALADTFTESFAHSVPLVTIGDATVPLDAVSGVSAS